MLELAVNVQDLRVVVHVMGGDSDSLLRLRKSGDGVEQLIRLLPSRELYELFFTLSLSPPVSRDAEPKDMLPSLLF
jgi:hypothetical protein